MAKFRETAMRYVFLLSAVLCIACVGVICVYLLGSGIPTMFEIGLDNFFGTTWKPGSGSYGIFPFIVGSVYVTAGAILIGVPIGVLCAVYLAWFCPKRVYKVLNPAVRLMAGIPSIIYGFFGLTVLVPMIQSMTGTSGKGLLTASLLLGIMILPTIIGTAEPALRAVPRPYYDGALALGATHERSVFSVVVPAAASGLMSGVILGIGRAIGETMAVIMIAGNQTRMPGGLFDGLRTMTSNIVLEMGYSTGLHRQALVATGVVLFVFILMINLLFSLSKKKEGTK